MKPIRYGIVGGGQGAFIGAVHRAAAALDGCYELVCGAFSSDAQRARESGSQLHLPPERNYPDYMVMLNGETSLPAEQRMQVVVIVTPNHLHVPIAIAALKAGFHVICDKPVATSLADATLLADVVQQTGRLFALTYTYAGFPMIEEARHRIARGDLGRLRRIDVSYRQGWLWRDIENQGQAGGNKQANWRTDPARSGPSCCLGDIGVHAFHLAEHVSNSRVQSLCADLTSHVPGRRLDDDATILLRFDNGARGALIASQICSGAENDITMQIYGELGGMIWSQTDNDRLLLNWPDRPTELVTMGGPGASPIQLTRCRLPPGHHSGYIEAFANLYRAIAKSLDSGVWPNPPGSDHWYPSIDTGVRSMAFIEAAIDNNDNNQKWSALP